jgi:AraC-like DNA-binding protein
VHAWTLENLAKEAGTSRSVLAEKSQLIIGIAPTQHLSQWPMLLAANVIWK